MLEALRISWSSPWLWATATLAWCWREANVGPDPGCQALGAGWLPGLADIGWSHQLGWYKGCHPGHSLLPRCWRCVHEILRRVGWSSFRMLAGISPMRFYILCKNEAPNIKKCIESLLNCGMDIVVMDSGSTDNTLSIVSQYPVTVVNYKYTNHCDAYNHITTSDSDAVCGIFDADMEMTPALAEDISRIPEDNE